MRDALDLLRRYALGVTLPVGVTLLGLAHPPQLESTNIALLYQLGVLGTALLAGLRPGILAAVLSSLAFHFFFVPAYYSFVLERQEDVLRLLTFLVVAVVTSSLAGRVRAAALDARRRADETEALYALSQRIGADIDAERMLPLIAEATCRLLAVPGARLLLADAQGDLALRAEAGQWQAKRAMVEVPLMQGARLRGTLRVQERADGQRFSDHDRQLLLLLAAQALLALDRAQLVSQRARAEALAHSDQLKSALLASVSHDLRTPLAVIKGAASTLQTATPPAPLLQSDLVQTIEREADRLNRIVGNLLVMSQIEAGALPIKGDWHDVAELIGSVLQRLAPTLHNRQVCVNLAPDLPLLWVNATLFDQVLTNLLENAARYTPLASALELGVGWNANEIAVTLRDHGPGIPESQRERIFDKFYRGENRSADGNSGLGLAICRGIVEAHGGQIWAASALGGGALFTFTLPLRQELITNEHTA